MLLNLFVRVLMVITVTLLIAGTVGLMVLNRRGERLLSVQTASLAPTLRPGDAIFIRPVPVPDLKPGSAISYHGWQVIAVAPGLGRVLNALSQPSNLILAVYLPAALIVAAEARRLARAYARPFYSVRLEACDLKPRSPIPTLSSTART